MPPHDIPNTPEIRATIAAAQDDAMQRMGLSGPRVEAWEDGYRAAKAPDSTFEWWYFDMQLDDGSTVVLTFSNKPHTTPSSPITPSVLLIYRDAAGHSVRQDLTAPASEFSASTDECDVRIGAHTVSGDLTTYRMHVEGDGVTVDLTLHRGAPSWRPGAGVTYFDKAQHDYLAWVVPVPYGTVEGTITVDGTSRAVTGTGYHDHNWGNRLMGDMLDHWYWGRAHIDDFTVVYVCMTTKGLFGLGQMNIPTFLLTNGETILTDDMLPLRLTTSGDTPGPGDQTYPTDLLWTWQTDDGSVRMHVTSPTMIEALDMSTPQPAWKRPIAHLLEHPMYYDFNADMELTINLGGVSTTVKGRTLYEKMMFR